MKYAIGLSLVLLLVGSPLEAQATTVEIEPTEPSSTDTIRIKISGASACPFASKPAVLGRLVVVSFSLGTCLAPPTPFTLTRFVPPLEPATYILVVLENIDGDVLEKITFDVSDAGTPSVPEGGAFLESASVPGFRFKVRITDQSGGTRLGSFEPDCLAEAICASGAVVGRSEVLLRIVGPKPNGHLWPTFVRFTTSTVEIWVERIDTAEVKYYRLEGAVPGSEELEGRFDRTGFLP